MNKRILGAILAVIIVAVGVVVVFAIGGNNKSPSTTNSTNSNKTSTSDKSQKAEATNSVTIKDFAFSPATITVKVGTKVTWTNQDAVGHTVTADSGNGPNSELIDQGKSYSYTFSAAGTYAYHCSPHPYMKGTVIVTN